MSTSSRYHQNVHNAKEDAKQAAQDAATSPVMNFLTRLGYLARGVVYGVIGVLALQVVLGKGGALTDTQGAIAAIGKTQAGGVLMYVTLVGLLSYGLWGLVRAFIDPWRKGNQANGIALRIGFAISGISYLILGWATYNLIQSGASPHNGSQSFQLQQMTSALLSKPWGDVLIAFIAVAITCVGLFQVSQGVHHKFGEQFSPYALTANQKKWIIRLGQFGIAARGLIFTLVGVYLFLAAYQHNPTLAKGIDGVLAALLAQPYGAWLLGIVALGLIAFGIYSGMSGLWLRLKK
jgi:hypothetical protein